MGGSGRIWSATSPCSSCTRSRTGSGCHGAASTGTTTTCRRRRTTRSSPPGHCRSAAGSCSSGCGRAGLRQRRNETPGRRVPGQALLRPPRLTRGSRVAVVAPAGPVPAARLDRGLSSCSVAGGWSPGARLGHRRGAGAPAPGGDGRAAGSGPPGGVDRSGRRRGLVCAGRVRLPPDRRLAGLHRDGRRGPPAPGRLLRRDRAARGGRRPAGHGQPARPGRDRGRRAGAGRCAVAAPDAVRTGSESRSCSPACGCVGWWAGWRRVCWWAATSASSTAGLGTPLSRAGRGRHRGPGGRRGAAVPDRRNAHPAAAQRLVRRRAGRGRRRVHARRAGAGIGPFGGAGRPPWTPCCSTGSDRSASRWCPAHRSGTWSTTGRCRWASRLASMRTRGSLRITRPPLA